MVLLLKTILYVACLAPLVFTCCYFTIKQSYDILDDYYRNPFTSRIEFMNTGRVKFPNVRVCPANWVDQQKQKSLNISDALLEFMLEMFIDNILVRKRYTSSEINAVQTELQHFSNSNPNLEYPFGVLDELRQPCKLLLRQCTWKGRSFDCCDPIRTLTVYTNMGLCIIFKLVKFEDSYQYMEGPFDGLQFGITDFKSRRATNKYNRLPLFGALVTILVSFRPFITQPQLAGLGSTTFVSLQLKTILKSQNCADLYPTSRLLVPGIRTSKGCLYECVIWEAYKKCGCLPSNFLSRETTQKFKVCSPRDYASCYHDKFYPNMSKMVVFCNEETKERCPEKCKENNFNPTSGVAPLPRGNGTRIDPETNEAFQYGKVFVYYSEIGTQIVREVRTQTANTILSNVGGLLGLWLGLSIFGLGSAFLKFAVMPCAEKISKYQKTRQIRMISQKSKIEIEYEKASDMIGAYCKMMQRINSKKDHVEKF